MKINYYCSKLALKQSGHMGFNSGDVLNIQAYKLYRDSNLKRFDKLSMHDVIRQSLHPRPYTWVLPVVIYRSETVALRNHTEHNGLLVYNIVNNEEINRQAKVVEVIKWVIELK